MLYSNKCCLLLASGQLHPSIREGLHALLIGTTNRFGKGDSDRLWLQGNATDFYYLLVTGVLQSSFPASYCTGSMLWQELLIHTSEFWSNPNPNLCPTPSLWMLILVMALFFPGLTVVEYIPNFSDESSTPLAQTSSSILIKLNLPLQLTLWKCFQLLIGKVSLPTSDNI